MEGVCFQDTEIRFGGPVSESGQQRKDIRCELCRTDTHHDLRAKYSYQRPLEDHKYCEHVYSIWTCAGCDTVTFEWQMVYPDGEEYGECFSTRNSLQEKLFQKLPPYLVQLYKEILICYQKDCLVTSTMALRALIESVCFDKGIREGNLERKIDGLSKFIPNSNIIDALHAFRNAGNDAAHRLEAPNRESLGQAIEVVEDVLNYLYELDYKAGKASNISKRAVLMKSESGSVQ